MLQQTSFQQRISNLQPFYNQPQQNYSKGVVQNSIVLDGVQVLIRFMQKHQPHYQPNYHTDTAQTVLDHIYNLPTFRNSTLLPLVASETTRMTASFTESCELLERYAHGFTSSTQNLSENDQRSFSILMLSLFQSTQFIFDKYEKYHDPSHAHLSMPAPENHKQRANYGLLAEHLQRAQRFIQAFGLQPVPQPSILDILSNANTSPQDIAAFQQWLNR